ncbi:hypothetical protein Tco_0825249 [Tanacetum coccineum]
MGTGGKWIRAMGGSLPKCNIVPSTPNGPVLHLEHQNTSREIVQKMKNKDRGLGNVQGWFYAVGMQKEKEKSLRVSCKERMPGLFSTDISQERGGQVGKENRIEDVPNRHKDFQKVFPEDLPRSEIKTIQRWSISELGDGPLRGLQVKPLGTQQRPPAGEKEENAFQLIKQKLCIVPNLRFYLEGKRRKAKVNVADALSDVKERIEPLREAYNPKGYTQGNLERVRWDTLLQSQELGLLAMRGNLDSGYARIHLSQNILSIPGSRKVYQVGEEIICGPLHEGDIATFVSKCMSCARVKVSIKDFGVADQNRITDGNGINLTLDFIKLLGRPKVSTPLGDCGIRLYKIAPFAAKGELIHWTKLGHGCLEQDSGKKTRDTCINYL